MRLYPFKLIFHGQTATFNFPTDGEPWPVSCGLSARSAGDMGNQAQRAAYLRKLGFKSSLFRQPEQGHTKRLAIVNGPAPAEAPLAGGRIGSPSQGVDGLLTADRQLVLGVTVADCLPIFLYDSENNVLALLHSGWKGTGIVSAAIDLMKATWGTRPSAVKALFGPCIQACCYQVDEQRAAAFQRDFAWAESLVSRQLGPVVERRQAGAFLNLQAANAALLRRAGVRELAVCRDCSFEDERLGSFRRQGATGFTRMLAFTGWF